MWLEMRIKTQIEILDGGEILVILSRPGNSDSSVFRGINLL